MTMNPMEWPCLLALTYLLSLFMGQVNGAGQSGTVADLQASIDISRQVRKTEISRALRLLKKHLIVGKNAKIVLKNSGKHLLIDGSERLSLIPDSAGKNDIEMKHKTVSQTLKS